MAQVFHATVVCTMHSSCRATTDLIPVPIGCALLFILNPGLNVIQQHLDITALRLDLVDKVSGFLCQGTAAGHTFEFTFRR